MTKADFDNTLIKILMPLRPINSNEWARFLKSNTLGVMTAYYFLPLFFSLFNLRDWTVAIDAIVIMILAAAFFKRQRLPKV